MSSSFSTLSGSLLEIWSDILDILEQLHTGSIEYTVMREEGRPVGLEVTIQCLLAEQKPEMIINKEGRVVKIPPKDVKKERFHLSSGV